MYIYIKFEIQKSIFLLHHLCPNVFIFLYVLLELFLARLLFTDSDIVMLGKWGFDGLEDWEYPGVRRGSLPGDNKSSPFCQELLDAFKAKAAETGKPRFFLTRAVAAGYATIDKASTPNANMADHSVGTRDELHESEVSQSLMFCFDNASPENSCFVLDLFRFISLRLRIAVFINAQRRDRNLSPFTSKGK